MAKAAWAGVARRAGALLARAVLPGAALAGAVLAGAAVLPASRLPAAAPEPQAATPEPQAAAGPAAAAAAVTVRVRPAPVYVERAGETQLLSFELELLNQTTAALELALVRMWGYDQAGRLLTYEKLDSNGTRPSIEVLGQRRLEPGKPLTVFNPFFRINTAAPLARLRFALRFSAAGGRREEATVEVQPLQYQQKTRLTLPIAGALVWAYEGSGFYSHHRRVDLADPFNRDLLGLRRNAERYALDLVVVDAQGEPYHGDPGPKENWVGYGFPLVAPAPGTIVAAVGDLPNDIPPDEALLAKNPGLEAGNYIVIDHHNGEYSALCHFQQGSLTVKKGDRVERGQPLGRMGRSGMGSQLVHVHYELQNEPDLFDADGLPTRFDGVRRVGDDAAHPGWIEPGWLLITPAAAAPAAASRHK